MLVLFVAISNLAQWGKIVSEEALFIFHTPGFSQNISSVEEYLYIIHEYFVKTQNQNKS